MSLAGESLMADIDSVPCFKIGIIHIRIYGFASLSGNPGRNMQPTTVLIVDDNAEFRGRVRSLISSEKEIQVIGEAGDGEQAVLEAARLHPDIVLMDVRMPGMNGLEAARRITGESSGTQVIILSQYDIDEYKQAAIESGARDYVVKKSMVHRLIPAMRAAVSEAI
jgi:DNA-binding NarL/FixJ family response regulator